MAQGGVRPDSAASSTRFLNRRVTKFEPAVKRRAEGRRPLKRGPRAQSGVPGSSGGGERHDRFGGVVAGGVGEPRIHGRFACPPRARARYGAGSAR